jgi:hypothetical protein
MQGGGMGVSFLQMVIARSLYRFKVYRWQNRIQRLLKIPLQQVHDVWSEEKLQTYKNYGILMGSLFSPPIF